jgi:predicted glycogen debranching enzyme
MGYLKFDKTKLINLEYSLKKEIVRTNRSGTYSCSTIIDCNTRKYHGLLICPIPELDNGRHVLLSSLDETIIQHEKEFNLGIHKYAGNHYEPKGHKYIRDFNSNPIPKLEYRVGGVILSKEKILVENESQILIKYTLIEAKSPTKLKFKPFLAFRNIHSLSKENMDINTKFNSVKNGISSNLYNGYPDLFMQFNKKPEFVPAPNWNYNIEYKQEHKRGYDYKEDLYIPGFFEIPIKKGESIIFSASLKENTPSALKRKFDSEVKKRIPREDFSTCLANTVQQFNIHNKTNIDIIAGYPWLPIRSRDALISLPGLTLPFDDKENYVKVLKTISKRLNGHLLKDVQEAQNNDYSLDIPLWFIWSVQQYYLRYKDDSILKQFSKTIKTIISGYINEKYIFEVKQNGLLYANYTYYPNSWMNSNTSDRYGYLVDANALWYNALCFTLEISEYIKSKKIIDTITGIKNNIEKSFTEVFWNEEQGYLNDFVTYDKVNKQVRPNQIFAASLPYSAIDKSQIKSIVDTVKSELLTNFGIRTLSPIDSDYIPKYKGNHYVRENAAYNGSAWPWLLTSYIEALHKIQPNITAKEGEYYLMKFEGELKTKGICSISELYHGNPPQKAKGAISFALSTGELIRLKNIIDNI